MQTDPRAAFIDRFGAFAGAEGLPPIAGRLFALLYYDGTTRALGDLAAELGVSRASISTNARLLAAIGLLVPVRHENDRRDHYRAAPNPFVGLLDGMTGRMTGMIAETGAIAEATADPGSRQRLQHFIDFHGGLAQVMRSFAERQSPNSEGTAP